MLAALFTGMAQVVLPAVLKYLRHNRYPAVVLDAPVRRVVELQIQIGVTLKPGGPAALPGGDLEDGPVAGDQGGATRVPFELP